MPKTFKTVLMLGATVFAFEASPLEADPGMNTTGGANVDVGARIQGENSGTPAGTTVERLMQREDALRSDNVLGDGLTVDEHTNVETRAEPLEDSKRLSFDEADTNNDGMIDEAEFSASIDTDSSIESFGEFDLNSDGSLDDEEYNLYYGADARTEDQVDAIE